MRKNFCFNKSCQKLNPISTWGKLLLMALFLFSSGLLLAQERSITGRVTDNSGSSLPGATVVVKGTTTGTITNADGDYAIRVAPNTTLVFSFVGMETQEIRVESQTSLNVTLKISSIGLDEVVAIGYGTQSRRTLTTAISSVSNEKIEDSAVSSLATALQGKAAGVRVYQSEGGMPGSDATIRVSDC